MRGAKRLDEGSWHHGQCDRCERVNASIEVEPGHRWYMRTRYCAEHDGQVVDFATYLGTTGNPVDSVIRVSVAHRNHHVRMYGEGCGQLRVDTIALIDRPSDMLTAYVWSTFTVQPYADQWIEAWREKSWDSVELA